ncbi:MAG: proteasome accessory factor PafA2 family protein [Chloroflexi bacterium]|nr:proteasome accessory factor PafA2 family protein [Chloroflexota bacterium]
MRRPAGIETEYGLNCEGFPRTGENGATGQNGGDGSGGPSAAVDFGYEASRVVRCADVPGAFRGWDYQDEDPYRDLRGMRVDRLARDPHDLQTPSPRSRQLTRDELLANTVLLNGARFYNDHNHPEYCTEACLSLLELVAHDKVGERVLFACEQRRNAELAAEYGPQTRVRLLKNNSDYHGRSYGTHENYLFSRTVPLEAVVRATIPFFVTRQLYAGAGKVGIEHSGGQVQPGFQLSQRADFFEERIGINTTAQRPIFNTRDEPHADRNKYRRLHMIVGDANRSEWATAMKVGTTALALDLIEDGWQPALELADPVGALRAISRDPDLTATIALTSGQAVRALDVQQRYFEAAERAFRGRDEETDWVLTEWREALDALAGDANRIADRVDWLAKRRLFDQVRRANGATGANDGWGDPSLRRLDLAYHLVDPNMSLYDALVKQGRIRRLLAEEQIEAARTSGPARTRGAVRALVLARFGEAVRRLEWDSITFGTNGREVRLQLDEIAGPVIERVEALAREAPDLESLIATMKGGTSA